MSWRVWNQWNALNLLISKVSLFVFFLLLSFACSLSCVIHFAEIELRYIEWIVDEMMKWNETEDRRWNWTTHHRSHICKKSRQSNSFFFSLSKPVEWGYCSERKRNRGVVNRWWIMIVWFEAQDIFLSRFSLVWIALHWHA